MKSLAACIAGLAVAGCQTAIPVTDVTKGATWTTWNQTLSVLQQFQNQIDSTRQRWDGRDPRAMTSIAGISEQQANVVQATGGPPNGAEFRTRLYQLYRKYADWAKSYAAFLERAAPGASAWVLGQTEPAQDLDLRKQELDVEFARFRSDYERWRRVQTP